MNSQVPEHLHHHDSKIEELLNSLAAALDLRKKEQGSPQIISVTKPVRRGISGLVGKIVDAVQSSLLSESLTGEEPNLTFLEEVEWYSSPMEEELSRFSLDTISPFDQAVFSDLKREARTLQIELKQLQDILHLLRQRKKTYDYLLLYSRGRKVHLLNLYDDIKRLESQVRELFKSAEHRAEALCDRAAQLRVRIFPSKHSAYTEQRK